MILYRWRETDLLEADVHVEGDGLPGVTDWGDAELPVGRRTAGDHLHCVGSRVVPYLEAKYTRRHFLSLFYHL